MRRGFISGWLGYRLATVFTKLTGIMTIRSRLRAHDLTNNIDYGWIGYRSVTELGAGALMEEWNTGPNTMKNFKYMAVGTSSTAENAGHTALLAEVESRVLCAKYSMGAGNVIDIVGQQTYTGSFALREHGVFNAATLGILFDRTMFSTVNVAPSTVIEWTYEITAATGG